MAYQALIDYHADGYLMGIYGERFPATFSEFSFQFLDRPEKIKPGNSAFPLPVPPDLWPDFWKHGRWNNIRVKTLD